jgi:hypothetical protein
MPRIRKHILKKYVEEAKESNKLKEGDRVKYGWFKRGTILGFSQPTYRESLLNIRIAIVKFDGGNIETPHKLIPTYNLKKLKDE